MDEVNNEPVQVPVTRSQPDAPSSEPTPATPSQPSAPNNKTGKVSHLKDKFKDTNKWPKIFRAANIVAFFGVVILIITIVILVFEVHTKPEASLVNTSEYQAVFVNATGTDGGQAYFGHITALNNQYVELNDVFYLEPGKTNQFTLNKLSCAIYTPNDPMVINRQQVEYWENVNNNSQVVQDINKWINQNLPCTSTSSTTPTTTSTTTTPSATQ